MARLPSNRTTAAPYLARWTAAGVGGGDNDDINTTTADASPIELPTPSMVDADMLVICPACAEVDSLPAWQLILADYVIQDQQAAAEYGMVIASQGIVSTQAPTVRRSDAAGAAGYYNHNPVQFDLRGLRGSDRQQRWFLAVAALGGEGTALYLMDFNVVKRRPL